MSKEHLGVILASQLEGFEGLLSVDKLTSGASKDTFSVWARVKGKKQHLAVRQGSVADVSTEVGTVDIATEALLMRVMREHGVPGPSIYGVFDSDQGIAPGFVMEWLDGETLGGRIVKAPELTEARSHLARRCGEVLATIHAVDPHTSGLADRLPYWTPEQLVRESWEVYKGLEIPSPMIDFTARWLLDNLPAAAGPSIVHGDFRNGNLMVTPDGLAAVLDWEICHLGDPVRDLGWMCVNSWRFGKSSLPVGGFGQVEDLLAGYEAVSGLRVSSSDLLFWQVFGSFWWSVATLRMAMSWVNGENTSPERPVIGRRSSEAQMDCVNLIIPGSDEVPERTVSDTSAGFPGTDHLLGSALVWLGEQVFPDEPRGKFLQRVAINTLQIAQRELELGPTHACAELARLRGLLDTDGSLLELRWQLIDRIRGACDLQSENLRTHLRATVAAQLAIDQPGYQSAA